MPETLQDYVKTLIRNSNITGMNKRFKKILLDAKVIKYDKVNGLILTWEKGNTFFAFKFWGELYSFWHADTNVEISEKMAALEMERKIKQRKLKSYKEE